jgi:hypothetical protein
MRSAVTASKWQKCGRFARTWPEQYDAAHPNRRAIHVTICVRSKYPATEGFDPDERWRATRRMMVVCTITTRVDAATGHDTHLLVHCMLSFAAIRSASASRARLNGKPICGRGRL